MTGNATRQEKVDGKRHNKRGEKKDKIRRDKVRQEKSKQGN